MTIFMVFEVRNSRFTMNDFGVYYRAASRLVEGENLYRPAEDGHYYYKYSPTAAMYFIPFAVFPFALAKVLYWLFLAALMCFGFYFCLKMVKPEFLKIPPKTINNRLLIIALILSVYLQRELHLGQVNHILLVIYLLIVYLLLKKHDTWAAVLWAMSVFIKPHGLIFLPYFLIKGNFKVMAYFGLFAAVLFFAPSIFWGPKITLTQQGLWFHELTVALGEKQELLRAANHTIFSVIARYSPLRLFNLSSTAIAIYQATILFLIAGLFLYLLKLGRDMEKNRILEMALLISFIPLLTSTDRSAFGFIELVVFLIIFNWEILPAWSKALAAAGFILTGAFMHDLVGRTIWNLWSNFSVITIGVVLILVSVASLRFRQIA